MNRGKENIWRFVLILYLAFFHSALPGQSQELSFDTTSLQKVIELLEQQSDYVFNYDPQLLNDYSYTGKIDANTIEEALLGVLFNTPFIHEIDENTVLIYRAEPNAYRICGKVRDALTLEPLIAANVAASDLIAGAQTDTSGFFDFNILAPKNQSFEISYIGYESQSFGVQSLTSGACPTYMLKINDAFFGEGITITGYILDGITQGDDYGSFELNFNQLSQSHSTVEHDILKTAQLLPGIGSIDDSASNLQVRGSNLGQNLILWEGVPLYNTGHIFGMISAINPFSVEGVSIYKGAHDPKYDNRVGGIIDISLTDSISNTLQGSIGTTLTEAHGNLEIPLAQDRLSLKLAGRRNISGLYNSPALISYTDKVFQYSFIDDQSNDPDLAILDTEQTLDYFDWSAKLIYNPTDRLSVNGGVYSNHQDFNYTFSFEGDPFVSEDNIRLETRAIYAETAYNVSEDWTTSLSFYHSEYANNYAQEGSENGVTINLFHQVNELKEKSFSVTNTINLAGQLDLTIGYEYNGKDLTLDLGDELDFDSEFAAIPQEQANFHNAFQSLSYTSKKLKINIGNRSSFYRQGSKWFHSPRMMLQYSLREGLKLKADAGAYHQFISQMTNLGIRPLRIDNPLWILNATDAQLSQDALKVAAGLVYHQNGWLIDLEAYYNQTDGITTITPQLGIVSAEIGFSTGRSQVKGFDALVKKQWSRFNAWVNYSLSKAEYSFPEIMAAPIATPFDIRHRVNFMMTFKLNKFQFSFNTGYHTGLPFSRANLQLNDSEPNPEPPFKYFQAYQSFNSERLKDYLRTDINAAYRYNLTASGSIKSEISLSLINLFNSMNFVAREYFVDYNYESDIYNLNYIEKVLLGRTPLLMVRIHW